MTTQGAKLLVFPIVVLVLGSYFLCSCRTKSLSASTQSQPSPIPGFPDTPAHLQSINTFPGPPSDAMRDHGWNLIKYLAPQGAKDPVWRSDPAWQPKCGVLDLSPYCSQNGGNAKNPIFPGTSRQTLSGNKGKPSTFSTVFYNQDTASFIVTSGLNTAEGLQNQIVNGDVDPSAHAVSLPHFPRSSIIVKEIWEGFNVRPNGTAQQAPFQPVAHAYIPGEVKMVGIQLQQVSQWPAISIKLDDTRKIDERTQCSDSAIYDENHPVPINCFYHVHSPKKCIIPVHPAPEVGDTTVIDYPCYGILVGFQIATGETDNWTWTTFWWTNSPKNDQEHFRGQPAGLNPQFTHFVMDTTFGPAGGAAKDARFVYNRYLEGPSGFGTQSDCFNCHSMAMYVPRCTVGSGDETCINHHTVTPGKSGTPVDYPPCSVPAKVIDRVKTGCVLLTGHVWSLATNQDPDTPSPAIMNARFPKADKEKPLQH